MRGAVRLAAVLGMTGAMAMSCAQGVVVDNSDDDDDGSGGGTTTTTDGSGGATTGTAAGGASMGCTSQAECNDNNACTDDACNAGVCVYTPVTIDDNNACTDDSCDPVMGLIHTPIDPDDMDACTSDSCDPATGVINTPSVDCTMLDDQCNQGICDPATGMCSAMPINEGMPCDDMSACSTAEVCTAGVCLDPGGGSYIFYETFADNMAGWTLGNEWQIGPALASSCASSCPGNDPSLDHTATADNGIAGVVIGGCAATVVHSDDCITSPPIDTTLQMGNASLSFWRHLHSDYPPFMTNTVQASADGVNWTTLVSQPSSSSCVNDSLWVQEVYDVTSLKSTTFQVRFCFSIGSTGVYSSGSWNVDDVVIGAPGCYP